MKYSKCNDRQKKAWRNIKNAASDHISILLNGCLDNAKDSQEYQECKKALENIEWLIEVVYNDALTTVYTKYGFHCGEVANMYLRDIRFCGKEFLMKITTHYCKKYQQEAIQEISKRL